MSPDQQPEKTSPKTPEYRLGYAPEFRSFVVDHAGVLRKVLEMIDELAGDRLEQDGLIVEKAWSTLGDDPRIKNRISLYQNYHYKVTVGEKSFFLKMSPTSAAPDGYGEFQSSRFAATELNIPGVEIVKAELGFSSRDRNYFVAEWDDRLRIPLLVQIQLLQDEFKENPANQELKNKLDSLMTRLNQLRGELKKHFIDSGENNMAYDEATDTIILFDLQLRKAEK